MKTDWDIIQDFYDIINVSEVNSAISGKIYSGQKPLNREDQDININVTTNKEGFIQKPVVNINAYALNVNNRPDYETLNSIGKTLINRLFEYRENQGNIDFEIVDQAIMPDPEQPQMSFFNIRMNVFTL